MSCEIVVTSPHKQVTQSVKKIGQELGLSVTVFESALEDAVSLIKTMLAKDSQRIWVIISRGATLKLLRREILTIPFVSIDTTEYDMILALDKGRILGKKIGLLASDPNIIEVVQQVSSILREPVNVYVYTNWQDFHIQVDKARRDGIDVLVGGGEAAETLAFERGMKHVPLLASEGTVRLALERTKDIIETRKQEKEKADQIKAIVNYSHEGIMAVDQDNRMTVFNPTAAKLFGLNETEVLGRPLSDLSFMRSLVEMFDGHQERLGYIHYTRNAVLLVNKVPVVDGERSKGTLETFKDISKIQEEESQIRKEVFAKGLVAKFSFDQIVHESSKMAELITKAKKYANTDCTVLIRGESGTGKELFAQSMHNGHLIRRNKPFVAINCASLDDNLLKSELFGYEDGSFTGARKGGKPGLFEIAHGGTIFLDEIGKIKPELQANLLRVLQEKEVRRIGSDRLIPVDVRVIAASNENLENLMNEGVFREDLYFRLNVLKLALPSLRERREDIPGLVSSMLQRCCTKYDKPVYSYPLMVIKRLQMLDWPGNVRQMEHLIERCVVLTENESDAARVAMEVIDEEFKQGMIPDATGPLAHDQINVGIGTLHEMETELIQKLSAFAKVSKSELALRLGISRPTLLKMLGNGRK